jgi:lysophospholipase III
MVFIRSKNVMWKQKYIAKFISLSGNYAGEARALKVFATGEDDFGVSGKILHSGQMSHPSQAFKLPFSRVYKSNEVLVRTRKRTYSSSQYKEFFHDLGYPTGYEFVENNKKHREDFSPPNVEIHCMFGSKQDTIAG